MLQKIYKIIVLATVIGTAIIANAEDAQNYTTDDLGFISFGQSYDIIRHQPLPAKPFNYGVINNDQDYKFNANSTSGTSFSGISWSNSDNNMNSWSTTAQVKAGFSLKMAKAKMVSQYGHSCKDTSGTQTGKIHYEVTALYSSEVHWSNFSYTISELATIMTPGFMAAVKAMAEATTSDAYLVAKNNFYSTYGAYFIYSLTLTQSSTLVADLYQSSSYNTSVTQNTASISGEVKGKSTAAGVTSASDFANGYANGSTDATFTCTVNSTPSSSSANSWITGISSAINGQALSALSASNAKTAINSPVPGPQSVITPTFTTPDPNNNFTITMSEAASKTDPKADAVAVAQQEMGNVPNAVVNQQQAAQAANNFVQNMLNGPADPADLNAVLFSLHQ